MPPRKRAASAPKTEPAQEPETLEAADTAGDDAAAEPDEAPANGSADPTPPDAPKPERSDVQAADKPCQECFPNGWPEVEGAFSVGCTHGTYIRKQD